MFVKNAWGILAVISIIIGGTYHGFLRQEDEGREGEYYYVYVVDPQKDDFKMVYEGEDGRYGSIKRWKQAEQQKEKDLVFAMNGGMYEPGGKPKGLYVEEGKQVTGIDLLENGYGNFYMQPNGVLYLTEEGVAGICKSTDYGARDQVRFATQSGPLLVINDVLNAKFQRGSNSKHIRNGVGLLDDGRLIFVMSKVKVNFYTFAEFFKSKGCKQALYLDGAVSRMYAPNKGVYQLDGDFGVMLGVVE